MTPHKPHDRCRNRPFALDIRAANAVMGVYLPRCFGAGARGGPKGRRCFFEHHI